MIVVLIVWALVATALSVTMRRVGTWRRVIGGSLAWPAIPLLIAVHRVRYVRRRR